MKQLTSVESTKLASLVSRLNLNLAAAGDSWRSAVAIAKEIKESELWRAEADTWYQFCEIKGWSPNRLSRLSNSDAFLLAISETTVPIGTVGISEGAVRELKKSPVVKAAAVLNELQATNTPVTAKAIKKVAQELSEEEQAKQDALSYLSNQAKGDIPSPVVAPTPVVLDELGWPIPPGIVGYWTRAREVMKGLMSALSKVKCEIEKGREDGDPVYLSLDQMTSGEINTSRYRIKIRMPYSVCTQCNGYPLLNGSCELCGSTGFNLESDSTSNPRIGDVLKIRAAAIAKKQQSKSV